YTPFAVNGALGFPIIAPFLADVDTRTPAIVGTDSQPIFLDLDTINGVVTMTWKDVNYFEFGGDKKNSFQLQLFDRGNGNFDMVFRYEDINWTTGDASGGTGGLGGTIARAGYSAGDGVNFFELPASGNQAQILDLESALGNTGVRGLWVFFVRDGRVFDPSQGIGVYSEVQHWAGGFTNEATGVIRGFRHGVQMRGNSFTGNFENLNVIEGLSGTGVDLEFFTFDGDFIVGEGARIAGGQTGARLALRTWNGDALINGEIEGNAENTGLHILTKDLLGGIQVGETGTITALSNALKLEVETVRDPVAIRGRVEATGENGVAIAILPYTDLGDGGEGGEGGEGFVDDYLGVSGSEALPLGIDMGLAAGLEITGAVLAPDTGTGIDVGNYVGVRGITNNGGKIDAGTALIHRDGFGSLTFSQKGAGAQTCGNIIFANTADDFAEFQGGNYTGEIAGAGENDFVFVNPNDADVAFVSGNAAGLGTFEVTDEDEDGSGRTVIGSSAFDANGEGFDVFAQTIILKGKVFVDDQTDLVATDLTFDQNSETSVFLTTDTSQKPSFVSDSPLVLKGALRAVLDSSFQGTTQREFVYEDVFQSIDSIINELSTAFAAGSSGLFTVSVEIEDAGVIEEDSLALGQQSLRALLTGGQTGNLVVTRLSLANLPCGGNSNQNAVGQALEKVFTDGTPGFSSTFNTIAQLSDICGAVDIFDSYAGVSLADSPFSIIQVDELLLELITRRIDPASNLDPANCQVVSVGRNCFTQYAQAGAVPGQVMSDGDPFAWLRTGNRRAGSTAVWGRAVGAFGERDPGPFSQGSEQQTAGLVAGADHVLDETFLAGAALQWTDSEVDFNNSLDQAEVQTLQIGVYFSWGDARLYVNGMGSVIVREFETRRTLITGETPRAEFDSVAGQGQLELGAVYELDGARVQPTLTVNYSKQWVDGYSETGAGVLGLTVADNEIESLSSTLGIKVAATLREGGFTVTPEFRAQWRHEYLDTRQVITASFVGAPGAPFTVRSDTVGRDTAILAAGLTMPAWENAVVYTDYEAALNEAYDSHTVSIGLRVSW
ncbi:MAG TPA: hypothetical protein DCL54_09395, partial [Alphaproteobacteria bacterium]|nr:hypothetical protein [Alphaproteobacteria bacterium]